MAWLLRLILVLRLTRVYRYLMWARRLGLGLGWTWCFATRRQVMVEAGGSVM